MSKMQDLARLGQAIWYDYIRRSFITSGELKKLVQQGLRGVTSNPAIFEKAIAGSNDYDQDMQRLIEGGSSVQAIYEALAVDDIQRAADVLRPVYDETKGLDGYVSLEVSPDLAHDTKGTVTEARRLFAAVARPNVMIKVPGTTAGVPAVETLISEGININVTLLFSLGHYEAVAKAYQSGIEKRAAKGGNVANVASVASFFVSRIDTAVDKELEKAGNKDLQGTIAVANAKAAYARFRELFRGPRWEALEKKGARVQRPLWASTGTKNPNLPDTIYVDELIGAHTVNTLPPATLDAFLDHGKLAVTVDKDLDGARKRMQDLSKYKVSLEAITAKLQEDGVEAFAKAFHDLMSSITMKRERLVAAGRSA
jgi:transaldolase